MCNHYRNHPEAISTWRDYIGWSQPFDMVPFSEVQIDVWPKRSGLVARIGEDGSRVIEPMAWGVPLTMPGKRPGTTVTKHVTNVRNLTSPFWRSMLNHPVQRCLVPFQSFAEPVIGGGRAEHWFRVLDRPVAAFAGIWRPSEAGAVFAFLTCEPNSLMAPLHPKAMPVILAEEAYECWLTADWADAQPLVQPFPSQLMAVESEGPDGVA